TRAPGPQMSKAAGPTGRWSEGRRETGRAAHIGAYRRSPPSVSSPPMGLLLDVRPQREPSGDRADRRTDTGQQGQHQQAAPPAQRGEPLVEVLQGPVHDEDLASYQ